MPALVRPLDVFAPAGNVVPATLPDMDVLNAVNTWIKRGMDETASMDSTPSRRRAVRAYVHARWFDRVHLEYAKDPSRVDVDGFYATQRTDAQIQSFRERADEWWDEYEKETGSSQDARGALRSTTASTTVRL